MATDDTSVVRAGDEALVTEPLEEVIDPENFTPRLLALLSNALVWRESHELRRRFRLGTNDWRVISVLALRPGASATEVSEFIGVNKAVVSKSVYTLTARALITLVDGPRGSRPMYLTAAGARMHDAMLPISMSGQDLILEGLAPEQIAHLNALLRRMIDQVREEQDTDEPSEARSVAEPAR
jgi:DNA-binding MarR family transcriptional regulator